MEGHIPACQGAISTSFVGILPGIKCYAWLLMGTLGINRTPMSYCYDPINAIHAKFQFRSPPNTFT